MNQHNLDKAARSTSKVERRAAVNQVASEYPVVGTFQGKHIAAELSKVIHGETQAEREEAAATALEMLVESGVWF
jgi:hypothetical protein